MIRRYIRGRSSAKNHIDPGQNQLQLGVRQLPYAIFKKIPIQRHNLRNIRHRVFFKSGKPGRKLNIPRRVRPSQIAGKRHACHGSDPAAVQRVSLHNHHRTPKTRAGPGKSWHIGPPDLGLRDHHSFRSKMRRAADETNPSLLSLGCPNSAQALSMASVTSSGACRATYSRIASLKSWLRDFLVRRARRSAP